MDIFEKIRAEEYTSKLPWPGPAEDKSIRLKLRKLYNEDTARLKEQFYLDLCEHSGEPDCNRTRIIFDKAWDSGHASGFHEVVSTFEDLVDFIERVNNNE